MLAVPYPSRPQPTCGPLQSRHAGPRGPRTAHRVAGPRPQGFESGRCNFSTHLPKAQHFIKPRSCELSTGSCGPCPAPVCVNKVLLEHSQGHSFTRPPKPLLRRNGGAGPDGQAPLVPHGKFAGSGPDDVTPGVHAAAARSVVRQARDPVQWELLAVWRCSCSPPAPGALSLLLASARLGLWSKVISACGTGSGLAEISVLTLPLADSFVNTSSPPAPSVTAVTHFPGSHGNKAVCSVQITIQARGGTIKKRLRVRSFQQKIPKVCLSVRQTAGDPGNTAGNSQRPPKGGGSRRCQSPRGTGDI